MLEEYSPYKIVHHSDKLLQLKKRDNSIVPLQIQLIVSNVCNQKCSFCAYRMVSYSSNEWFNDTQVLSYYKIKETIDCMKEMKIPAVQLTGGGEPLVHPKIKTVLNDIIDNKLDIALVTNGMNLDSETCDLLANATWIRVSLDSGKSDTYSFIRNVKNGIFEKIIKNIEMLVQRKKSSIIGIGFVVNKENFKEIVTATKIAKNLGVDNIRISAAFTSMGYSYFEGFEKEARELSKEAETYSDNKFTVFNLFNDRIKDTFEGKQNYDFCPTKDLMVYVGADYNVYTCCTLAYNHNGYIGSIKNQSFKSLWESKQKQDFYSKHTPRTMCQLPCLYKNKNDFINYCIKENPKHINYI